MTLTRDLPLVPKHSALLFIDVQNFSAHKKGAEFESLLPAEFDKKYGWYFDQLESRIIPNMQALQTASRNAEIEVVYTTIESLTLDGRDRSLDYKITGFNVPKGSWDGKVIDQIKPISDEMIFPKSSSSVFISTHIDYVLRKNLAEGVMISGCCEGDCHYRLGNEWMSQRFNKERMPVLRTRVPREKVRLRWLGEQGTAALAHEVSTFQSDLSDEIAAETGGSGHE